MKSLLAGHLSLSEARRTHLELFLHEAPPGKTLREDIQSVYPSHAENQSGELLILEVKNPDFVGNEPLV